MQKSDEMMKKKRFWMLTAGLVLALSTGLFVAIGTNWAESLLNPMTTVETPAKPVVLDADMIRVGISDDGMTELEYPSATIAGTGDTDITDKATGKKLATIAANQNFRIRRSSNGFIIEKSGGEPLGPFPGELKITTSPEHRLKVTSVTRKGIIPHYRGVLEITPGYSGPQQFTVVNVLPMQDYLKAVVPNELPMSYGYEAVKAQAVAARNYAIHPREKPWPQFDICDSQYCQAYYGANTEHPGTNKALSETQGLIALYNGEPILALYSSSHGGYAESYENVFAEPKTNRFPAAPIPYLRGGPDRGESRDLSREENARHFYSNKVDSFDIHSPNYRWQKYWTRQELEPVLNAGLLEASKDPLTKPFVKPVFMPGDRIGTLKSITIPQRGVSGKAMTLTIEGTNGRWTVDTQFVIRRVLKSNGRMLPSANIVLEQLRDKNGNLIAVKAVGGGFGHGVGMSQLGASFMSKQGKRFTDILQHYYKGVAIGTIPIVARPNQGMKTEFYVDNPQGTLHVKADQIDDVRLSVNDATITGAQLKPDGNGKWILPVKNHLEGGKLNTLQIHPLSVGSGTVKAWIEVVEAKSSL